MQLSCIVTTCSYQPSRQWMMMSLTRRQVWTRVIVIRRHAPVLVRAPVPLARGPALRHFVGWKRRSLVAHRTSSGTAMNSVSPTTSWPHTLTTSKSPRRELRRQGGVFSGSKSSSPTHGTCTASLTTVCCTDDDSGLGMWSNNHILAIQQHATRSGWSILTADWMVRLTVCSWRVTGIVTSFVMH